MAKEGEYIPKDTPPAGEAAARTFDPAKNATLEGRLPERAAQPVASVKPTGKGIMSVPQPPNFQTVGGPYSNVKADPNFTLKGDPYTKSYSKELATVKPVGPKAPIIETSPDIKAGVEAAKTAGAKRVAAARSVAESATPVGMAEKIVKPGVVQSAKNVMKGILPQVTGAQLAYELFENPALKSQREAALSRGMAKIGATPENVYGLPVKTSGVQEEKLPSLFQEPKTVSAKTEAAILPGGAVDQAAPSAKKEQPRAFETTRVPGPAVSTEPVAPSYTPEQIEEFAQPKAGQAGMQQAVSKGKGGNFRYVQGPDGKIVKQNTDSGEVVPMYQGVTGNVLAPGEESPMAKMVRDSRAAKAAAREAAFREALIRQAFQPIDGSTNIADVGTIKRNRLMAQQLLAQMDRGKQADAALGLEEKKLASTERATAATQEQNRLAKEADQRIRDRQAAATEKQADIAERAEERKAKAPRTAIYKGQKIQGSPEELEYEKRQIDAKQSAQWDKKNPKPSGMLTTNDDVIKHYEKRAKALGYDPDVATAANLAKRIQGTLQSMSPEDREEVNRQFQGQYGVPYSEFIASE